MNELTAPGELEQELTEARHAIRQNDRLLHQLAHELRGQVATLLLWESILRTAHDEELRQQALDAIRRSAQAQDMLVSGLLDLTRLLDGTLELHRAPIAIEDVIADVLHQMAPRLDAKQLRLEWEDGEGRALVCADPIRIRQILSSVMSHVVDCAEPGDRLEVFVRREGGSVSVDVSGRGPSPASDLPKVDEALHGIQLALARELTIAHGGTLAASAKGDGPGAAFRLTLVGS